MCYFFIGFVYSQNNNFEPTWWKLTNFSGNLRVTGTYNEVEYLINNTSKKTNTTGVFGGISLFTKSYVYHPNLLSIDLSLGYEPNIKKVQQLVSPEYSISNTSNFLKVKTTFFKKANYTLSSYFSMNESYVNRENFTNVKNEDKNLGAILDLKFKIFPINITYNNYDVTITEIESQRIENRIENKLDVITSQYYGASKNKVFMKFLKSDNITKTNTPGNDGSNYRYEFSQTDFLITNKYNFKSNTLLSSVNYNNFNTFNSNRNNFSIINTLNSDPVKPLTWRVNQFFRQVDANGNENRNNSILGTVSHQLYNSLFSNASIRYNHQTFNISSESNLFAKIGVDYKKKLPLESKIMINTFAEKQFTKRKGTDEYINIYNDPFLLSDGQLLIIEKHEVDISTIVVKDETETILYQENFDYELLQVGSFVEVRRIIGGLIPNNSIVLIDYTYFQPSNYTINGTLLSSTINLSLFKNRLNLFYQISNKTYKDQEELSFLSLDNYTRNYYGVGVQLWLFSGGFSFDDFKSDILPYELLNYNLNINGKIGRKLNFRIGYNASKYKTIGIDGRKEDHEFINGNLNYIISQNTQLRLHVYGRKINYDEVNRDAITGSLDFRTKYNKIYINLTIRADEKNEYDRNSKFFGIDLTLKRKF